jgi:hypothetical protein
MVAYAGKVDALAGRPAPRRRNGAIRGGGASHGVESGQEMTMTETLGILSALLLVPLAVSIGDLQPGQAAGRNIITFATNPEDADGLHNVVVLVESLRAFGGRFRDAPVWVFASKQLLESEKMMVARLGTLHAELRSSRTPPEALPYFLASKVFAAAQAEQDAAQTSTFLVWMDTDTVVLQEPEEFILADSISFGYRPVMHQRIGSLYAEPLDEFWSRVYAKLSVPPNAVFPVTTPADNKVLRAYFNAGLLVVRPECGVFHRWARDFTSLYEDPYFQEACRKDEFKRIFLHQVALVGAVFGQLSPAQMVLLSDLVNVPLFFKEQFGAQREFDSVEGVVTLRHESYLRNPDARWREKLKGPADRVAWLKEHFPAER